MAKLVSQRNPAKWKLHRIPSTNLTDILQEGHSEAYVINYTLNFHLRSSN